MSIPFLDQLTHWYTPIESPVGQVQLDPSGEYEWWDAGYHVAMQPSIARLQAGKWGVAGYDGPGGDPEFDPEPFFMQENDGGLFSGGVLGSSRGVLAGVQKSQVGYTLSIRNKINGAPTTGHWWYDNLGAYDIYIGCSHALDINNARISSWDVFERPYKPVVIGGVALLSTQSPVLGYMPATGNPLYIGVFLVEPGDEPLREFWQNFTNSEEYL